MIRKERRLPGQETIERKSLRAFLRYEPHPLTFGTSGLRGLIDHITDLEAYINTTGFMRYLFYKKDIRRTDAVYIAGDLRPSTHSEQRSILRAVSAAIQDSGCSVQYLGRIPTPAITCFAMQKGRPCVMVTGSHIPFDRNGIKFCKSTGEVLKTEEPAILQFVKEVRQSVYASPAAGTIFDTDGMIKREYRRELPDTNHEAKLLYIRRYLDFFPVDGLRGLRILVYEHSAVGRDILTEVLKGLGADVISVGRSDTFVPIDTEDIRDEQIRALQRLVELHSDKNRPIDGVISTDGDSDRPLVAGMRDGQVHFLNGDLLGLVTALYLKADIAAVPISVNDAVEMEFHQRKKLLLKTKIGSPYVIQAMIQACSMRRGKKRIVGWEANGGFLTGSDIEIHGRILKALPTRDAVLPILCALFFALDRKCRLAEIFSSLPQRFSKSGLIDHFPSETSQKMISKFSPANKKIIQVNFGRNFITLETGQGRTRKIPVSHKTSRALLAKKEQLENCFLPAEGFSKIDWINFLDGIRVGFVNRDVAHLRPSGNAPQMRIYSNSGSEERSSAIVSFGISEPHGIIRRIENDLRLDNTIREYLQSPRAVPLRGRVRNYDWGGYEWIPSLLGIENPDRRPFAELWMGGHASCPSDAFISGEWISIKTLLNAGAPRILGARAARRFHGNLPYLFKVLDVRKMLSLQVHPTAAQCRLGFRRENSAQIPLDARNRNYRDDQYKPEIHVALTDFWMLHGFRPLQQILQVLNGTPEFQGILPSGYTSLPPAKQDSGDRSKILKAIYRTIMMMPQERVDSILSSLLARLSKEKELRKDSPDYWALGASDFISSEGHFDRGIFSIYLLNLIHLQPGEGTFQPTGILHSYLEGKTIELMTNSDSVLRGGLTSKHIDIPELLKVVRFQDGKPQIIKGMPTSSNESTYHAPTTAFELSRIELLPHRDYSSKRRHGAETLMILDGAIVVNASDSIFTLNRGNILFAPAGTPYRLSCPHKAVIYKASVPEGRG